ncbi:cell division suppressor protein YneA [Neobacillus dielmonensis]|uniref:cell division suppressor protein YneA n=1 Tax=Neobacillus dielmonensis TaxID=1347369 RepID=UPI0005A968CC|nr:LysM peptidoglycan-binding domain-containing protein [Neobacillus dielmonensis]
MKNLWTQYSYAIILLLISCAFALIFTIQHRPNDQEQYMKITVSDGDSLWKISKTYANDHSMTNKEFVNWVKKHNKKIDDEIYPGEEIIIPIGNDVSTVTELAGAMEE